MSLRFIVACALVLLPAAVAAPARAQKFEPHEKGALARIVYPDSTVSYNDRCPVTRSPLSLEIEPVYVNGRPVSFCCSPCPGKFSKNPARWMKAIAPRLTCMVHPRKPAAFDSTLVGFVNQDVFFFSDADALTEFLMAPLKYAKTLGDPVSQHRFRPTAKSPHLEYQGRDYYFESKDTFEQFKTAPDNYALRHGGPE